MNDTTLLHETESENEMLIRRRQRWIFSLENHMCDCVNRSKNNPLLIKERNFLFDVDDNYSTNMNEIVKIYFTSYPIRASWGLLRHIFLTIDEMEIHTGMSGDHIRELVFTTRNYFQDDSRPEGYVLLCKNCLADMLYIMSEKTKKFHFIYNNCDTMNPVIAQTSIIWISIIALCVGTILMLNVEINFFTIFMFSPIISFILMLLINRCESYNTRINDKLYQCVHTSQKFFNCA